MAASSHPSEKGAVPALSATPLVEATLQRAIEQFLYYEARLLDDRWFDEWYELIADDIHYFIDPLQPAQARGRSRIFRTPTTPRCSTRTSAVSRRESAGYIPG